MILYLFYNTNLLTDVKRQEMKIGYVDNVNFYVEGSDFEEAYERLGDMMTWANGGQAWSNDHNSHFEMSKLTLMGFSCRCAPDPQRPGKTMPEVRPTLTIGGMTIKAVTAHKFLGVIFDQELHWKEQAECVIAKATKWTLCARCLARPAMGILPHQMCQLYQAVAVPSFTYAADVWFAPVDRSDGKQRARGSAGIARKLSSVQHLATMAITGALCTTATDVMEIHTNLFPTKFLLHRLCYRATLRLVALPDFHPLHKIVKQVARRDIK